MVALALVHVFFPPYFNWKKELQSLCLVNREMMKVHTFFIALTVFLMGILCLTCSNELIDTALGKKLSLGLGIFWTIRLLFQFFVYSKALWKGKTFETIVHIVFSILWMYFSFVFLLVFFNR
jgi:hypothetical protein